MWQKTWKKAILYAHCVVQCTWKYHRMFLRLWNSSGSQINFATRSPIGCLHLILYNVLGNSYHRMISEALRSSLGRSQINLDMYTQIPNLLLAHHPAQWTMVYWTSFTSFCTMNHDLLKLLHIILYNETWFRPLQYNSLILISCPHFLDTPTSYLIHVTLHWNSWKVLWVVSDTTRKCCNNCFDTTRKCCNNSFDRTRKYTYQFNE